MNIILLSGGSGKRLWPLSNEFRSKQFIRLFKNDKGEYESMAERIYRQIMTVDPNAVITVATSKSQISEIHNQMDASVAVSVEPCRRDTFPAIALATAYLHYVCGVSEEEPVVVCPVDPYVDNTYFEFLHELWKDAETGRSNLTLMGIEPTYPSEKYGYIIPETNEAVSNVSAFKEKPDKEAANEYISKGALWNAGVFACKVGYVLKKAHELIDFTDYNDLYSKYETVDKISFDYAVVEKEKYIHVLRYCGQWKDIGSWDTLTETLNQAAIGNVIMNDSCKNVNVINELNVPVLAMGLQNVVISASADGILVSDKCETSKIKSYIDKIDLPVMYAEKSWGSYQILNIEKGSYTLKVTLNAGHRIDYDGQDEHNEVWVVLDGEGQSFADIQKKKIKSGDVITVEAGCRHTVIADTKLNLIKIQFGEEISTKDKKLLSFCESFN